MSKSPQDKGKGFEDPPSAKEDLSHLARFDPSDEYYYDNPKVLDFRNKTQATWLLPDGKSIKRDDLETLASDGPVKVLFQRRVPDTSKPKRSKLRRLAESIGVGTATTLGLASFPMFLVMAGDRIPSTFSQTYTDAKYPWKSETIQGEFSTADCVGYFQPQGLEKAVDMGMTTEYMINQ